MLSILIPIYNFDVRRLVSELDRQAALLDVALRDTGAWMMPLRSFFQQKNRELGRSCRTFVTKN
jgi:hypothetical protein